MITVSIYIKSESTGEFQRIELFNDEKISVTSSIQNVNDISKIFTDFSQTFTIPASKQNNKIFKHWYDGDLTNGFSTLVKADSFIELDTIPFRNGKIQLESCNIKNGKPQEYSITFIGNLGNLKDKFAGLFLKDLDSTAYNFPYNNTNYVRDKVVTTAASGDIMFPLISSNNYWTYGSGTYNINNATTPIRANNLFPAIKLSAIFAMIQSQFNVNFSGSFLNSGRFTAAYLWLKNADVFNSVAAPEIVTYTQGNTISVFPALPNGQYKELTVEIEATAAGITYEIFIYKNGVYWRDLVLISDLTIQTYEVGALDNGNNIYTILIRSSSVMTFNSTAEIRTYNPSPKTLVSTETRTKSNNQTTIGAVSLASSFMPEIKIEDFFSAILKMFNLTAFSSDGINYTLEQIEDFYNSGQIKDLSKYIVSDDFGLNRVNVYKKVNFEYEKSESLVNVAYNSANGIEYGNLQLNTGFEGEEYSIKLPFENLNFTNLKDKLQVGFSLKTDFQKYIPKPVILYDYNPTALTSLSATNFYFANAPTGNGTSYTAYKAFGQEYFDGVDTYTLNFNQQQSTLTNELVTNSLYQNYYSNYFANIFNRKSRLLKVKAILPISVLTSIKLNDRILIRDRKYLINTMNTDLTTGEVNFELLTDFRNA